MIPTYLPSDPWRLKRWAYHDRDDLILFAETVFRIPISSQDWFSSWKCLKTFIFLSAEILTSITEKSCKKKLITHTPAAGWKFQLRQHEDGVRGRVWVRGRGPGQVRARLRRGDQEAPGVATELRRHHRQLLRGGFRADPEEEGVALHHHLLLTLWDVCHRSVLTKLYYNNELNINSKFNRLITRWSNFLSIFKVDVS